MSVFYVPWWVLLACSLASAVATYLVLRRTQAGHSPWALVPLTATLAPVVLVGAMVVALTLSTLLSALVEDRTGGAATNPPSEPPAPSERTTRDSTATVEMPQPATTEEEQPTSTLPVPLSPLPEPAPHSKTSAASVVGPMKPAFD